MWVVELLFQKGKPQVGIRLPVNAAEFIFATVKQTSIAGRFLRKYNKKVKKLVLVFFAFIILGVVALVWFVSSITSLNTDKDLRRFIVQKGETATMIGTNLQEESFIKSAIAFRIYAQVTQSAKNIKPGQYDLSSNLSIRRIVAKLLEGPTEMWVTIPEGLRREEIATRFVESFGLKGKGANDFYDTFLDLTLGQEGYLFPDTYLFPKDATAAVVVKAIRATYDTRVTFGVTKNQLIIASILERETITDEERPVVAGILFKRINAGWPLQADATVQYAVASGTCRTNGLTCKWWEPVGHDDLSINSPYNTYKFPGLPPGPICNPGLSSLKAVVNPVDSDYWYYLHDSDGVIHYASTLEEQNANVVKYLD